MRSGPQARHLTEGQSWYATHYVAGPTLQQQVGAGGALAPGPTQALAVGLAEAIVAIHTAGVVHHDPKPANVILADDGPKVLDFGIARTVDESAITRTGGLVGSPGWMSPERFRGTTGPEANIFSWGALVAYTATGRPPFGTGSAEALMYQVLNEEPDLAGLPSALVETVTGALAKDPTTRPSAAELVPMVARGYGAPSDAAATEVAATIIDRTWTPPPLSGQDNELSREELAADLITKGLEIAHQRFGEEPAGPIRRLYRKLHWNYLLPWQIRAEHWLRRGR